jgi:hypothetical protein
MFQSFWQKVKIIFTDKQLLARVGFIFAIIIVFRALASVPVPGVNAASLAQFLNNNQFFGFLNIFSGGGLNNLSIVLLGVGFVMFRERYNDLCQQARAGEESAIQLVAVVRRFALLTKVLSRTTNGANL